MSAATAGAAWDPANWQQQVEELLACSSIMGEDFRVVWAPGSRQAEQQQEQEGEEDLEPEALLESGPPPEPSQLSCEVAVHVEVPQGGVQVLIADEASPSGASHGADGSSGAHRGAAAAAAGGASTSSSQGDAGASTGAGSCTSSACARHAGAGGGMPVGHPIHHLTPIRVHLTLPLDYPSDSPPQAELHAMWLTPAQAAQLAGTLASHFEAVGAGAPILYDWLETLRATALAEIGVAAFGKLVVRDRAQEYTAATPSAAASGSAHTASSTLDAALAAAAVAAASASTSAGAGAGGGQHQQAGADGRTEAGAGNSAGGQGAAGAPPLSPGPSEAAAMARAFSSGMGMQPAHEVALAILRYAASREAEVFDGSVVHCAICFDEQLGAKCVRLGCGHAFCRGCISTYARTQVADGAVENVRCPDTGCRAQVAPEVMRGVLSEEEFERWEVLLLQRTLDKMEDVVYCPRCNSIVLEDKDHCAQCPKCFFVFCSLCNDAWHPGQQCLSPEARLEVLQQRAHRRGPATGDRQRAEMDLINQMKSMVTVLGTSKKCPSCGMAITKSEGCNKMVCSYCNTFWCWKCCKVIEGYDHFGSASCALFDQEEIERWNRLMNQGDRYFEIQANNNVVENLRRNNGLHAGFHIRFTRCVSCGQFNLKQGGNNLIRCHACNTAFCYLCRENLRQKPGSHFGPSKRCKQHTDD
uniref:RBR-type E3 ubiquitin transferase n=1 Tax=Chlamydomonas leiostraca TaxID=1034604 RepID=A0A7S0WUX6_9CHLO|mmetsp:Transcript_28799/g.73415  ORF Transcript_28799/g.73415 Transcript_28799/m.73415 type:complete len:698 (+) Transcript_28799:406-2499(+)